MPERIEILLELTERVKGIAEMTAAGNVTRQLNTDVNNLVKGLNSLDSTTQRTVAQARNLETRLEAGTISEQHFNSQLRILINTLDNSRMSAENAAAAFNTKYTNSLEKARIAAEKLAAAQARLTGPATPFGFGPQVTTYGGATPGLPPTGAGRPGGGQAGVGAALTAFQVLGAFHVVRNITDIISDATTATMEFNVAAQSLGQILGVSSDSAAGFVAQATALGVSVDTVTEAYRTFGDRLGRATGLFGEPTKGSKDMKRAIDELGVTITNADGSLRPLDDILLDVADKMQEMGPGIKTTAIATALFGQRADELMVTLLKGREGMEAFIKFTKEAGLAMPQESVDRLREFGVQWQKVSLAVQGFLTHIGLGLAEGGYLTGLAETLTDATHTLILAQSAFVGLGAVGQAVIIGITTDLVEMVLAIQKGPAAIQELAIQRLEAFQKDPFGRLEVLLKANQEAQEKFLAQRGFRLKTQDEVLKSILAGTYGSVGDLLTPTEGQPGGGLSLFPDEETVDKQEEALDQLAEDYDEAMLKRQNYLEEHNRKMYELDRDYNQKTDELEQDFNLDRERELQDYNQKVRDEYAKFYADQLLKQSDFNIKSYRQIEDFNRDQTDRRNNFYDGQAEKREDFERNQFEDQQDYELKRSRLIEDEARKNIESASRTAEQRYRIEERANEQMAALQEHWDEILLRLRIGGDQDSIAQAEQRAAEELAIEQARGQAELDRFDQTQTSQTQQSDLQLRLDRMEQDFRIESERKRQHFEDGQAQAASDFEAEQVLREEEFSLKQARAAEDFTREQAERESNFNAEMEQRARQFEIKRDREAEDFQINQARRKAEYFTQLDDLEFQHQRELDELNLDVNRKRQRYESAYAEYHTAQINGENAMVETALWGANVRIQIAQNEFDNVSRLRREYGMDAQSDMFARDNNPGRAFGGQVSGPLGSPQMILAHGGETIVPPASPQYYSNVRHGDQINVSTTSNVTANMNRGDPYQIAQLVSREIARQANSRKGFRS